MNTLSDKIRSGTATNSMIADYLGWKDVATPEGMFYNVWLTQGGKKYTTMPNWIGNSEDALTLLPDGWVVFSLTNDPVSVQGYWLASFRKLDAGADVFTLVEDTHKKLSGAILLAVIQILGQSE